LKTCNILPPPSTLLQLTFITWEFRKPISKLNSRNVLSVADSSTYCPHPPPSYSWHSIPESSESLYLNRIPGTF
jgi:hypothetical protein